MAPHPPLRLFWWNKTARFGAAILPFVVANVAGRRIARCRHVLSSSLHGVMGADVFAAPRSWGDLAGSLAEPTFKVRDPAEAIGRDLDRAAVPQNIRAKVQDLPEEETPNRRPVAATANSSKQSFPAALAA